MGSVSCVGPVGRVVSSGRVELCDCVSTSRSSGRVGLFGRVGPFDHVGPCGCVSTSGPFGHLGSVCHLVFWLDAVATSYCTKGKRLTDWYIGWSFGWMQ